MEVVITIIFGVCLIYFVLMVLLVAKFKKIEKKDPKLTSEQFEAKLKANDNIKFAQEQNTALQKKCKQKEIEPKNVADAKRERETILTRILKK